MEVIVAHHQQDNKENIPPSTPKRTNSEPLIAQCCTSIVKRRFRSPLRDITNMFNPSVQATTAAALTDLQLHSSLSSRIINYRKRKAADDIDLMHKSCSKMLRKEFR